MTFYNPKTGKLKVAAKQKIVKALFSGSYKQQHSALCGNYRSHSPLCCIGVAGKALGVYDNTEPTDRETTTFDVASRIGLDKIKINGTPAVNRLVSMNDTDQADFPTIAKWIKENL